VSEWKVPDWRNPAQYPSDCSLRQSAWEFLRRNPEYRARWREHIEPSYDPTLRFQDRVGAVEPAYGVPPEKQAELVHRFSLETFPPSPNDNYPPLFTGTGLCWTEERGPRMLLYPGQIAVIFDLERPIEWQMAEARRIFAREQKYAKEEKRIKPAHRNRTELFARYLRVLDGVDAGATHTEIGAVLFKNQSSKQRLFAVRDYWDAATRLRDKDYLFIAAGAEESDRPFETQF
jgi:hypothetical protein